MTEPTTPAEIIARYLAAIRGIWADPKPVRAAAAVDTDGEPILPWPPYPRMRAPGPRLLKVGEIIAAATALSGLSTARIISPCRDTRLVTWRWCIMWLACRHTEATVTMIGRTLNRDYTTVIHGRDHVRDDPERFAAQIEALERRLGLRKRK